MAGDNWITLWQLLKCIGAPLAKQLIIVPFAKFDDNIWENKGIVQRKLMLVRSVIN
jgi:hypothetical protein